MAGKKKGKKSKTIKLSKLNTSTTHNDGREFQLKDETGELTPAMVRVKGTLSDCHRKWQRDNQAVLRKSRENAGMFLLMDRDHHANMIVDWSGITLDDDSPFEYSPDNAKVLLEVAPYIADQILAFYSNLGNFTRG